MSEPIVQSAGTSADLELGEVLNSLSSISESLLESYTLLAERARALEGELATKNAELERKVLEAEAMRAHLETVLGALPTGVVVRDGVGRIVRVNPAVCAILETTEQELLEHNGHPELLGHEAIGQAREIQLASGHSRIVEQRWTDFHTASGVSGSVELVDDRTEYAHLTERLHSVDKLAALGSMASGIAHEIRNPMNAVRGYAELFRREFDAESRQGKWASKICEGVDEADTIISNMLSFGSPEKLRRDRVCAAELVESAIELAQRSIPAGVKQSLWSIQSSVECPDFQADHIKLRQALRNLVANAIQAQPEGGQVHITCALRAGEIVFDICDAGPGIPADLRRRVVDPFFTTRAEGTGLGLALVHTIAELHGGRLEVSPASAPAHLGGGAQLILKVPYHNCK